MKKVQMTNPQLHPILSKLGIQVTLHPDSHLVFSPAPGVETQWQRARVHLSGDNAIEFSVSDALRSFSASFNPDGRLTALNCSTGIPIGATNDVIEMFIEEAKIAIESLVLLH